MRMRMGMGMGLIRRHYTPEAVLPPSVTRPFVNVQQASVLPPPAAEGEALRQEPGPELSGTVWAAPGLLCAAP